MNNLVSLAMQYLTPDVVNRIASALGVDKSVIGKAATAAVPGLLGMFANAASRPDGARKLANAVGQQSAGILDSLASTIGGPGQQSLVNSGISALKFASRWFGDLPHLPARSANLPGWARDQVRR